MSVIERSKCPTCGGNVVIHTAGEGTSHMVPANSADQTEAFIALDEFRDGLTEALNAHGVPAMPSWREAIDWLAANGGAGGREEGQG